MWETSTLRTSGNEDLGTLAEYDPLTRSEEEGRTASNLVHRD